MQAPLFIVGTGRCGSTLLSRMLQRHPSVLSISEILALLQPPLLAAKTLDGPTLWHLLNTAQPILDTIRRHHLRMPGAEVVLGAELGKSIVERVPPLCDALAYLLPEPAAIWSIHQELEPIMRGWSQDRPGVLLLRLFEWLRERLGRRLWVERSGASLAYLPWLLAEFPDARFVHLFRDGRECAFSMSHHDYFCLGFLGAVLKSRTGHNPYPSQDLFLEMRDEVEAFFGDSPFTPWDILSRFQLPDNWHALLPESFDVETFRRTRIAPHLFGVSWSSMIIRGLIHLTRLPPGRVLTLHYDELTASPETELKRLIQFLDPDLDQPDWVAAAADLVRVQTPGWWKLPDEERDLLNLTCGPGLRLMRQLARVC